MSQFLAISPIFWAMPLNPSESLRLVSSPTEEGVDRARAAAQLSRLGRGPGSNLDLCPINWTTPEPGESYTRKVPGSRYPF